jgi:hypothetical protein
MIRYRPFMRDSVEVAVELLLGNSFGAQDVGLNANDNYNAIDKKQGNAM